MVLMSGEAERVAFDLHKNSMHYKRPEEPTKGLRDFHGGEILSEGPTCYLNGRLLIFKGWSILQGSHLVVVVPNFRQPGKVLEAVRKKYPENHSPLSNAYRIKYEESLALHRKTGEE